MGRPFSSLSPCFYTVANRGDAAIVRPHLRLCEGFSSMNMSDPTFQTLTLIVPMLAIFYFLLWRPQQQRAKQLRQQIDGLRRGDTVVAAGIVVRVVKSSNAEDPEILVEIADNVQVKVLKSALSDVRPRAQGDEKN